MADHLFVDDVRYGRLVRAIRRRHAWRQRDLSAAAGCSQQTISLIERGHFGSLSVRQLRAVAAALDARVELTLSWRGGDADRLDDARHAHLVERATDDLRRLGWTVQLEVTYSHYGERGSIDILAVREDARAVAVNEVKSEITAIEELARRHDQKARLAGMICGERFGWRPRSVGRLLIVPDGRTVRRTIATHRATFETVYPRRTVEVRHWLQDPVGPIAGIWFLSDTHEGGASRTSVRIRVPKRAPARSAEERAGGLDAAPTNADGR